jgi:hypothetical protein
MAPKEKKMKYSAHEESRMRQAIFAATGCQKAFTKVKKQGGFSLPLQVERNRNIIEKIEKSFKCKIKARKMEENFDGGSNTKSWVRFDIVC